MASVAWDYPRTGIWRFSRRDAILVALAALHAAMLAVWPVAPLIAVGVWWNSNTIAHNFIHRPFFRSAGMNRLFSAALSVLLGIPQTLWRDRHLAHHAGVEWRLRVSRQLAVETALVLCLWTALASLRTALFPVGVSSGISRRPGIVRDAGALGTRGGTAHQPLRARLQLSVLQRRIPRRAPRRSRDSLDGAAAPHRARRRRQPVAAPAALAGRHGRWRLSSAWCCGRPGCSASFCGAHRRAFRALLPQLPTVRRVTIVGGGLFPRTALILRELLPAAHLTIVDSNPRNLETARAFLGGEHRVPQRALRGR